LVSPPTATISKSNPLACDLLSVADFFRSNSIDPVISFCYTLPKRPKERGGELAKEADIALAEYKNDFSQRRGEHGNTKDGRLVARAKPA
jgi:hypothetical protein